MTYFTFFILSYTFEVQCIFSQSHFAPVMYWNAQQRYVHSGNGTGQSRPRTFDKLHLNPRSHLSSIVTSTNIWCTELHSIEYCIVSYNEVMFLLWLKRGKYYLTRWTLKSSYRQLVGFILKNVILYSKADSLLNKNQTALSFNKHSNVPT